MLFLAPLILITLILPRQCTVLSQSLFSTQRLVLPQSKFSSSLPSLLPPSPSNAPQTKTLLPLFLTDERFNIFTWSSPSVDNNEANIMARETFVFHLQEPAILQLIDFKHPGDRFQVFDNDLSLGKTTLPNVMAASKDEDNHGSLYASTPALAMADKRDRYSKGQILLAPGNHSITIKVWNASPSIDVHGTDVSGGAIRLIGTPMKPQKFYRGLDEDEEDENDDEENEDDEEHNDDYGDGEVVTAMITVVVPPLTKERWEHTEPRVMTVTDVLGVSAATYTPPAGRTNLIRNPRCGMN
ncbi:hypothetical protein BCR42DRAFT_475140 [Absidia repens]|uniref:Uncharacterized protein n=1 Tax=Absidia repens TaxID=90262 RepID=A0A1X2ISV7_9FUNG|nr:hypothetical protein BCR42DRAFT_475140 [Absidia repens]